MINQEIITNLNKILGDLKKEDSELQFNIIKKILSDPKLIEEINLTEKDILDRLEYIYNYGFLTDKNKKEILSIISNLSKKITEYSFEDIDFFIIKLKEWLEHEKEYIDYKPGAENKEYINLIDLIHSKNQVLVVNNLELKYEKGKIYYNNKEVQGIKINKKIFNIKVELTGEHYTSLEEINQIHQARKLLSSSNRQFNIGLDNYCYLAEPGRLNNLNIDKIKKILGANNAEGFITVKIIVPLKKVWIRAKEGYPAKFAIESKNLPIYCPKPNLGYKVRIGDKIKYLAA